jgi:hypothetical protein
MGAHRVQIETDKNGVENHYEIWVQMDRLSIFETDRADHEEI